MIIECTNCHSKYQYDEERFERKPSKKIKCAKCQHIFEIFNPAFAAVNPPVKPVGESTAMKQAAPPRTEPPKQSTTSESSLPQPSTTDKLAGTLQMPTGKRLSLAVIDGPDAGSVFRIEKPRVTIGRSADLTLNDTEASRNHAAVEVRDTIYTLRDLGSTNGTMFEGERINDPVELQNHSEFIVGTSTVMLIVTEDT